MILAVDIQWPATLPLPHSDFSGMPRNATLLSADHMGRQHRRSRRTKKFDDVSARWNLTPAQYTIFRSFFLTTLGNGAAKFELEFRQPRNSGNSFWAVRFLGGYNVKVNDGIWTVDAALELIGFIKDAPTPEVPDPPDPGEDPPAPPKAWGIFYAASEDSGGEAERFVLSDGRVLYVKDEE